MIRNPAHLEDGVYDLVVVGAGIVGACIAWDASLRGLRVALVDRDDFGSGASQNSLKIVHGGLRYLQRMELRTMRSAVRERRFWLRAAPHLVEPLPVVVPDYGGRRDNRFLLRAALALNDVLSADRNRAQPPERQLPSGSLLTPAECLRMAPDLPASGLRGGTLFYDAQMYSSERLVLEVVLAAQASGATVVNHAEVVASRTENRGVHIRVADRISGSELDVRSRFLVHATGAFAPPPAGSSPASDCPRYAAALNLVVRGGSGPAAYALSTAPSSATGAGRRLFFVPWRGRTMVGTAHYPIEPERALDREALVARFLEEVNAAAQGRRLTDHDILLTHVGLLPVLAEGNSGALALQRTGRILEDPSPVITVISVKYTSARALAEAVVDRVVGRLDLGARPCVTRTARLPGAPERPIGELVRETIRRCGGRLAPDIAEHLVRAYGARADEVAAMAVSEPALARRVVEGRPVILAQFCHAVESEMAMRPGDLIYRRTELGAVGAVTGGVFAAGEDSITLYARTRSRTGEASG